MAIRKEELQLNTQQDMSSEDIYVLKKSVHGVCVIIPAGLNSGNMKFCGWLKIRTQNSLSERNTRYLLIMMNLQDGMQMLSFRKQSRKNF